MLGLVFLSTLGSSLAGFTLHFAHWNTKVGTTFLLVLLNVLQPVIFTMSSCNCCAVELSLTMRFFLFLKEYAYISTT